MQKIISSNVIDIKYNRFKGNSKYLPLNFNRFDFERGLKSVDLKEFWFINKASSQKEEVYDMLLNMYIKCLDNDFSFLDDFGGEELLLDYKAERLLNIINKVQKSKYKTKDLKNIYKFKNQQNKELHLYIKESRGNLSLLLIDLYHMGIYGDKIVDDKAITIPMEKIYKRHKNNMCMLDDMKNIIDSKS